MKNWTASKTINEQGVDYREVPLSGKISELQFTIKPNSDFWRAGFKLLDPNTTIIPLRTRDSLLFHLGSSASDDDYGFTAYINGNPLDLNKTSKYPRDRLLTIRLEISHNNFLKVYVNGSIEFKPTFHLKNPNIREKVALLAWGDKNDYAVDFMDITAENWVGVRDKKTQKTVTRNSNPSLRVTGNKNVFLNSHVNGYTEVGGENNVFSKTKIGKTDVQLSDFLKTVMIPLVVAVVAGLILYYVFGVGKP